MEEERTFITPGVEKRQHRRARLVTEIRCESLGRQEMLLSRDISVGGIFVSTAEPFPNDSEVALVLRLEDAGPLLNCRGRVAYAVKGLGMGIQFSELSEETRGAIEKFVDETA